MITNCECVYRTIVAVAGDDFSVVASDTRLSDGFMIHSRDAPKTYKLLVTFALQFIGIFLFTFLLSAVVFDGHIFCS